ncbi:MAG: zinc ribbon domain-containing protein [Desulfatiglandaceae bacterium]|jgi:putative FmdB family regulatory protein
MPIYEYQCRKCGNIFEKLCFASDDEKEIGCPTCDEKDVERLLSCFSSGASGPGIGEGLGSSNCSSGGGFS